jgi:MFS family permease
MAEKDSNDGLNLVVKYSSKYILYAAGVFGLCNLLDIFVSNASPLTQSYIVEEFFVSQGIAANIGYSQLNLLMIIGLPFMILSLGFKFMADKRGRKPALIVTIIGMGISAVLIAFSQNFTMYMIGNILGGLFLTTDIQLMMITEESPIEKRSRYLAFARIIGLVGAILVPVSRQIFLSGENPNWRAIYYFPILLAIVCTLISLTTLKESSVFLTMKEQKAQAMPETDVEKKEGLIKALKKLSKTPHYKVALITSIAGLLGTLGGMAARSFMEPLLTQTFSLTEVNIIYYLRYGISIVLGLFIGEVRDKVGRREGLIATLAIQCIFLGLFFWFIGNLWVIPTGLVYGIFIYSVWMNSVTSGLIVNELTPTKYRGTMNVMVGILSFGIMIAWMVIQGVLILFVSFQVVLFIATIPFSILGIIIAFFKIPETKGTDLTTIAEK